MINPIGRPNSQPPVNPKARRRQWLYFLRQVPMGRVMSRYEMEGGTALYGYNLDPEIEAAEEAGVILPIDSGYKKVDYFEY